MSVPSHELQSLSAPATTPVDSHRAAAGAVRTLCAALASSGRDPAAAAEPAPAPSPAEERPPPPAACGAVVVAPETSSTAACGAAAGDELALGDAAVAVAFHLGTVLGLHPPGGGGAGGAPAPPVPDVVSAVRGDARLVPALALLAARGDALGRRVAVACVSALTGSAYPGDPAPAPAVVVRDLTRPLRRLARGPASDTLTLRVVPSPPESMGGAGGHHPSTPPPPSCPSSATSAAAAPPPPTPLAEFHGCLELLSARCPFVRDRVTPAMRLAGRGAVDVPEATASSAALEAVLSYCAHGAAVVNTLSEALAVAAAAKRMGLPDLQEDMEDVAKASDPSSQRQPLLCRLGITPTLLSESVPTLSRSRPRLCAHAAIPSCPAAGADDARGPPGGFAVRDGAGALRRRPPAARRVGG